MLSEPRVAVVLLQGMQVARRGVPGGSGPAVTTLRTKGRRPRQSPQATADQRSDVPPTRQAQGHTHLGVKGELVHLDALAGRPATKHTTQGRVFECSVLSASGSRAQEGPQGEEAAGARGRLPKWEAAQCGGTSTAD
jgi:hypothetical protein